MNDSELAYEVIKTACQIGPAATIAPQNTNPGTPLSVPTMLGSLARSCLVQAISWAPVADAPSQAPTILVTWQSASGTPFVYNASTTATGGASFWFYLPPTASIVEVSIANNDTGSNAIAASAELQILATR